MSWIETIPGIGDVFKTVQGIIRNFVRDPNEADRAATEITLAFSGVLKSEIESRYWLAGNWRPLVMLLIAGALAAKSIIGNVFEMASDYVLFSLLVMGLLGYKLDGKVIEFLAAMFKFGESKTKQKEK